MYLSKNICYNITALWDILNQKCVKKIMPISGCTNHRAINAKKNWCFLTIFQNWSVHKNQLKVLLGEAKIRSRFFFRLVFQNSFFGCKRRRIPHSFSSQKYLTVYLFEVFLINLALKININFVNYFFVRDNFH